MQRRSTIVVSIVGVIILALGFLSTPLMKHVRNRTWDGIVSITSAIFHIESTDPSQSTMDTIKRLTLENTRLTSELTDYHRLREQLKAPAFATMHPVIAHVISRPIDTLQSEYVINKGISEGVDTGDAVVVNGSALVGFISNVSLNSAVVKTVFNPTTSITVETVSTDDTVSPARGLLTSSFQTSISMGTIPRDATISTGQSVVTTSDGAQVPYGIVVGTIATIHKTEHEAYQSATIDLPYNPDTVEAVTVLAPP